jgi:hypothetical protein
MLKKVTLLLPLSFNDGSRVPKLKEMVGQFGAYPTREEREAFVRTAEYQKMRELIAQAQDRFGLVAGATPKQGVSMLVRLPRSLHAALEREAAAEGVGIDQLVVTKLAVNLQSAVGTR